MAQVVICNIDDSLIDRLKARAAAHGISLEQQLRDILAKAATPDRTELLAEIDRIQAMTPPLPPDTEFPRAEDLVREDRDSR
jgi:plasmid stability protein